MNLNKLTFFISLFLISCVPEIKNFYFVRNDVEEKDNKEYYNIKISDSVKCSLILNEYFATDEFSAILNFHYSNFDYTIDNLDFLIIAKNSNDSIKLLPMKYVTYKEDESTEMFDKYEVNNFNQFPDIARLVRLRKLYSFRQYVLYFNDIKFEEYKYYDVYLTVKISYHNKQFDKYDKIGFIRKKKIYMQESI